MKSRKTIHLTTPEGILSYPWLFHRQPPMEEGGKSQYSTSIIFPAGTDLTPLTEAVADVAAAQWGDKVTEMKIHWPFRSEPKVGYPEGCTYISPRSNYAPDVVGLIPDPEDGKPLPITDEDAVYPGVIAILRVTCYAYERSVKRGVTFGLDAVQLVRRGPRIDGRASARDIFMADPSAVASLDDLTDGRGNDPARTTTSSSYTDLLVG